MEVRGGEGLNGLGEVEVWGNLEVEGEEGKWGGGGEGRGELCLRLSRNVGVCWVHGRVTLCPPNEQLQTHTRAHRIHSLRD